MEGIHIDWPDLLPEQICSLLGCLGIVNQIKLCHGMKTSQTLELHGPCAPA